MKFGYLIEPPFCFRAADGSAAGADVEVARAVLSIAGHEGFDPVEAQFADLLPGLAAGRWQMTTGLFPTDARRRIAEFSLPLWALPDGMLVRKGNPESIGGYASAAAGGTRIAVVRDQVQLEAARHAGIHPSRIAIFDTYAEAASAVVEGQAEAYASVARAHASFCAANAGLAVECVTVSPAEMLPAFGCFAFARGDDALRRSVDAALSAYLGSGAHRAVMARFGFSAAEVDPAVDAIRQSYKMIT